MSLPEMCCVTYIASRQLHGFGCVRNLWTCSCTYQHLVALLHWMILGIPKSFSLHGDPWTSSPSSRVWTFTTDFQSLSLQVNFFSLIPSSQYFVVIFLEYKRGSLLHFLTLLSYIPFFIERKEIALPLIQGIHLFDILPVTLHLSPLWTFYIFITQHTFQLSLSWCTPPSTFYYHGMLMFFYICISLWNVFSSTFWL